MIPSDDVHKICMKSEKYFRECYSNNKLATSKKGKFVNDVLHLFVGENIFLKLIDHQIDQDPSSCSFIKISYSNLFRYKNEV